MGRERFEIDDDIRKASTLPGWFYSDPELFARSRERIFARSWQFAGDGDRLKGPGKVFPTTLLEGCLDEPLLLTRDAGDQVHCLSNVCTHRGNLLCKGEGVEQGLRCGYHGRRFGLDGRFHSMPEFEGAAGFPSEKDDLPRVPFGRWGKFLFASLQPDHPFEALVAEMDARIGWLPLGEAVLDPSRSRDYLVKAHWALYCDNYLEGFHIPFVHGALNQALDYSSYRTELFPYASLQVGVASGDENVFDLPRSSPDFGRPIAGYYFWLFPNTMLNVYPWGISVNLVKPLAPDRTRVSYLSYVWDASRLDRGAGSNLDRVEREDETVVESEQQGVCSRLYRGGRYSPRRETGVHHFHRLLARFLNDHPRQ
jgi:phenylpropionate dioxygenase-like ring-hydroxylating dioxygenase large terminal subunit